MATSSNRRDSLVRALRHARTDFTLTNARTFADAVINAPVGVFESSPLGVLPRPGAPELSSHASSAAQAAIGDVARTMPPTRPRMLSEQMASLELTVGVLDNATEEQSYTLTLGDHGGNVLVAGDSAVEVTTSIVSIITAAATQVGAAGAQFYVIDGGTSLSGVRVFPNVGGYACVSNDVGDSERVERYLEEIRRVVELRQSVMARRGVTSFGEYWESKQEHPVSGDPYGRLFLVIGQAALYFGGDDDMRTRTTLLARLMTLGQHLGVHVIAGSAGNPLGYKIDPLFTAYIHHRIRDVNLGGIIYRSYLNRAEAKLIPAEAASILDTETGSYGRILPPHIIADGPRSDATVNELGVWLASKISDRAPEIAVVPAELSPNEVLAEMETMTASPEARRAVPMGISVADLSIVTLADSSPDRPISGNLIIAGDTASGKSNTLRWLLRWITETYGPGEAAVYLADTGFQWMTERDMLREQQLLGGYTADPHKMDTFLTGIAEVVKGREPSNPDAMTAREYRERSWWTGREIFIIIDPGQKVMLGGAFGRGGVGDELCKVLSERNDLGARLWMTLSSNELLGAVQGARPGMAALLAGNANVLLLSGSVGGTVFGAIGTDHAVGFKRRRPGRGQLYNPQWTHYPIVQIPHARSGEERP